MTATFETQGLVEQLDPAALAAAIAADEPASLDAPEPIKRSSRTSVMALSVCALAINGAAAIYTWPSGLPSLNLSSLADLLPRQEASAPKPDPVVVALKDIQSTPAATHGFAAGEQSGIAAKRGCAAGGFDGAAFAAAEHHGRTGRCEEGIFAAVHADCEDRLAAKCHDVGRHVLRSKSACALWTVRRDAQADRSAVEICRSRFSWRSAAERACHRFGPGELKIGSGK
ncbi:hypothetical protein ACVWXM_008392 [Bradyrhizobium sp. GM7.3]